MNIFYNKHGLHDTMIIWFGKTDDFITKTDNQNYWSFYDVDNKLVGLNILDISKKYKIAEGRLFYDFEIENILRNEISGDDFEQIETNTSAFVVSKIVDIEKIKNSHLNKCQVDTGQKTIQIVCGAANAKKDMLVVLATTNIIMNNGMFIKPSKLLDVHSEGMLCSYKELGIKSDKTGIIELSNSHTVGDIFNLSYANLK